ncbi:MAG TPA: HTTM domain-containing protein, partial [Planctomycetaceae bacterium]|nr:HTTM domain-containing protein [Planctomycetaceae bacterium]
DRWGGGRFGMWLTTVRHVPLLMSWGTLAFELSFPVLIWIPRWRLPLVALAFAVHATMGWLLSLGIFSPVMFAALLAFLREQDLARISGFVRSLSFHWRVRTEEVLVSAGESLQVPPEGWTSATVRSRRESPARHTVRNAVFHLFTAGAFVAAGCAVQFSYDWYGVFGRRSLSALPEVSADDVSEMLAGRPPAWEDYVHRVELGSRFGGNQMFGSPDRFRIGQRAYLLTQMPMPHPTVELEGLLIAPDGRPCARFTHRFDAGFSYAINGFELTPELSPGSYRIILRVEDFVVAERRFELER